MIFKFSLLYFLSFYNASTDGTSVDIDAEIQTGPLFQTALPFFRKKTLAAQPLNFHFSIRTFGYDPKERLFKPALSLGFR